MRRRSFLMGSAATLAMPAVVVRAAERSADQWPSRPVTIVVPFGAGGSADLVARVFARGLEVKYGKSFVVENRGGAGGIIGTAVVAKAPADGYTLLLGTASTLAINPSMYARLPYDPETAFVPISPLVQFANLLLVNNNVPVKTAAEFISYMKANDGKLNYGSSGNGTSSHLCAVMLMHASGVSMTHIPFHGFPEEMTALIDGQLTFMFDNITSEWPFVKSGQARPLASSTAKRLEIAPDIPTMGETIAGFEAAAWQAILAPAGTPEPIVSQVARDIRELFTSADTLAFLRNVGGETLPMRPDEFAQFIVRERAKWAQVVKAAGVRIE
jgi:tripartite-type tricarboxylate transporter receptor subunit TctC